MLLIWPDNHAELCFILIDFELKLTGSLSDLTLQDKEKVTPLILRNIWDVFSDFDALPTGKY